MPYLDTDGLNALWTKIKNLVDESIPDIPDSDIVDSGTSGLWTYTKFSNGQYFAYAYTSYSVAFSSIGNYHYRGSFKVPAAPFTTEVVRGVIANVGTQVGSFSGFNGFNSTVYAYADKAETRTIYPMFIVIGRWQ